MESGLLLPGMFYFDNDRHSTNVGAIGAFGFRVGAEISLSSGINGLFFRARSRAHNMNRISTNP